MQSALVNLNPKIQKGIRTVFGAVLVAGIMMMATSSSYAFLNPNLELIQAQVVTPVTPPSVESRHFRIITNNLHRGRIGHEYHGRILALDFTGSDSTTLTIENLPPGLEQGDCNQYGIGSHRFVKCDINGEPEVAGTFVVQATLENNLGNLVTRNYELKIK